MKPIPTEVIANLRFVTNDPRLRAFGRTADAANAAFRPLLRLNSADGYIQQIGPASWSPLGRFHQILIDTLEFHRRSTDDTRTDQTNQR